MEKKEGTWEITLNSRGETVSVKLDGEELEQTEDEEILSRVRPGPVDLGKIYTYGNGRCFKRHCIWF